MQSIKTEPASGVLLLPSHLFFVRSVALPAGISPEELPSFVEVSLEQISPFALNQLYYGYHLPADASHLLVFAAYRKQLSVYEDEAWAAADLVLPSFASVLGLSREGPTLAFLEDDQEVTAVYWSAGSEVPDRVLSRRIDATADAESAEEARGELRRKLGSLPDQLKTLVLENPKGKFRDRNLLFELRQEGEANRISAEIVRPYYLTMDVRDKAFLHTTRQVQRQNRWLWTAVLAIFAVFLALGIFEAALFAGSKILDTREAKIRSLEPEVARIMQQEELALRLEELSGERLLPFEMLSFLNQYRPPSVYYTRMVTTGLRSFEIEALTPKSQDVDRFQRLLEEADALEKVEIRGLRLRAQDGRSSFTLAGTFRPGALTKLSPPGSGDSEDVTPDDFESDAPESDAPEEEMAPVVGGGADGNSGRSRPPLEDVPERESPVQEEPEEAFGTPLPHVPVGDVPVGAGAEGDEQGGRDPVGAPTPLPDLPLGDVPVGDLGSDEEEDL